MEVTLESDSVDPLYKPTSLEGFRPDTLFRPELTGRDYGRTVPADVALGGRPELVSESHAYEDILEPGSIVEVLVLQFHSP